MKLHQALFLSWGDLIKATFFQVKVSEKAGQSLADPENYENLFPNFQKSLKAQKMLAKERRHRLPADQYRRVAVSPAPVVPF